MNRPGRQGNGDARDGGLPRASEGRPVRSGPDRSPTPGFVLADATAYRLG